MIYPEYISAVLSVLRGGGYEAYVVGGSVRDSLIGLAPNDFDITTSALPEQTIWLFSDFKLVTTGLKHGTVTIISDGHPVEVTTFRIDGDYKDSRHPSEVLFTDSIVADLSRRDFTVNAMAYDDERGVIDPFEDYFSAFVFLNFRFPFFSQGFSCFPVAKLCAMGYNISKFFTREDADDG